VLVVPHFLVYIGFVQAIYDSSRDVFMLFRKAARTVNRHSILTQDGVQVTINREERAGRGQTVP